MNTLQKPQCAHQKTGRKARRAGTQPFTNIFASLDLVLRGLGYQPDINRVWTGQRPDHSSSPARRILHVNASQFLLFAFSLMPLFWVTRLLF